jgi:multiple sugar transport system ATP-binding protein
MENISLAPTKVRGTSKKEIQDKAVELLNRVGLADKKDSKPGELSGGQQQRVAIARTLSTGPKILFMDEPLSNLDAKLRMEMRTELKRLHLETSSTFVYVTHDQLEAMTLSTKICLLKEGLLQQYQPPLSVYRDPSNFFVADFVGSPNINIIEMIGNVVNVDEVKLVNPSLSLLFTPTSKVVSISENQQLLLGIRPEDIVIDESGEFEAEVYSTLPSGMETIVKIKINDIILTSVVFGDVDFEIGKKVKISFPKNKYLLFDKESELQLSNGKLS